MKLIIQIPAYNEEKTIAKVIKSIPKRTVGIKKVEVLVYDDGSTDETIANAKKAGADYVFSNKYNLGLAQTFSLALKKSLSLGADIIVSTDADNQYDQGEIPKLIKPIIKNNADLVTGNRQILKLKHMPVSKKLGNILGSYVLRVITNSKIQDASSGFRAYSKECAESLLLLSNHTYTHEVLLQTSFKNMHIVEIPVKFRKRQTGKSRLINNVPSHIKKALLTIIRAVLLYKSFKILVTIGIFISFLGLIGIIRFLYFYSIGNGNGHIQSLIISSIFIGIGFNTIVMGIIADLISINRKIIEEKK